jgi:hypothetical protein
MMGGAADGYRKQNEEMRKAEEEKRKMGESEREDAYRKELEALSTPDVAYKERLAAHQQAVKQAELEASTAGTAANIERNPAAGGLLAPQADESEPMLGAPTPARAPGSIIAKNGIGAVTAMNAEAARPEAKQMPQAPTAPGIVDMLDYATKRATIDIRHGKMDGAGIIQLAQARKQIEDEGFKDALLSIHNGDIQGGIDAFNQYGKRRVKLVDAKPIEADIGGVKMQSHIVTVEDENGNRQTINAAQALNGIRKMENQLDTAIKLMQLRQNAKHQDESLAESRDYHRGVIDVARNKATRTGGLTVPQQRTNAEIDAAREYVAGMSAEEIRRRTAQYSTTGRENPDYDPTLASKVRQSQHRKYGEDTDFANIASPADDATPDIGARFASDPVMKGHRLGNKTPQGIEVLDANGKLIGHYN